MLTPESVDALKFEILENTLVLSMSEVRVFWVPRSQ